MGREETSVEELRACINMVHLQQGVLDKWEWRLSKDGIFNTKSAYWSLVVVKENGFSVGEVKIFKKIWDRIAPLLLRGRLYGGGSLLETT